MSQPWCADQSYQDSHPAEILASDKAIAQASVGEVRAMLTHCSRGERFCDGYWDDALQSGKIVAVLKRLQTLGEAMAEHE